jgi:hypothetical protein
MMCIDPDRVFTDFDHKVIDFSFEKEFDNDWHQGHAMEDIYKWRSEEKEAHEDHAEHGGHNSR